VAPSSAAAAPLVFDAPADAANRQGNATERALAAGAAPEVAARQAMRPNPHAGMLPAGAFAPVSLLNGLDAGTSAATQTNPLPVLVNITDHATLPGAGRYRLRNCFMLGTGFGDLSAERVYIRFSRLSCVDRENKLVLSQEVQGYMVDSDGKIGLRGTITDRQGARLGKALLAGFAQGLAGALGQAQATVTTTPAAGAVSTLGGEAALRAAGLQGAQTATSQLAEFYLREAQSIFPVISVDTGRTGTVVFTSNAALNWGVADARFVEEVRPVNNARPGGG
jgi:conjugal transfer pilus assembly protein TraB